MNGSILPRLALLSIGALALGAIAYALARKRAASAQTTPAQARSENAQKLGDEAPEASEASHNTSSHIQMPLSPIFEGFQGDEARDEVRHVQAWHPQVIVEPGGAAEARVAERALRGFEAWYAQWQAERPARLAKKMEEMATERRAARAERLAREGVPLKSWWASALEVSAAAAQNARAPHYYAQDCRRAARGFGVPPEALAAYAFESALEDVMALDRPLRAKAIRAFAERLDQARAAPIQGALAISLADKSLCAPVAPAWFTQGAQALLWRDSAARQLARTYMTRAAAQLDCAVATLALCALQTPLAQVLEWGRVGALNAQLRALETERRETELWARLEKLFSASRETR